MIAKYAERVTVHPDRYGTARSLPPLWLVLHTSEGREGPGAGAQLAEFLTLPGDRVSSSGNKYGSSYHAVINGSEVIPAVLDQRVAYSAPGSNTEGLHVVLPGKAGQTREEWLDDFSRVQITTLAEYLVDMRELYGIPLERLTPAELQAETRGYCDHAAVRDAFGKTTHWDVGPAFPWDVLAAEIRRLSNPTGAAMIPINRRMSDTRKYGPGGRLTPGVPLRLELPEDVKTARACQISAAVVEPSAAGYLTAAGSTPLPLTSFCNYSTDTIQGTTIVDVIAGSIYVEASAECFVVVDLQAIWT